MPQERPKSKNIACGDVVPGCAFTATADTEEELVAQVAAHAAHDHGVAVRLHYELPFIQGETIGPFVRAHLPELDDLLTVVESRITS